MPKIHSMTEEQWLASQKEVSALLSEATYTVSAIWVCTFDQSVDECDSQFPCSPDCQFENN